VSLTTIILAAGKSTRMLSLKSKILFKISAEPIIQHVYNAARKIKSNDIICVLSNPLEELTKFIKENNIKSALQKKPSGTADAVKSALKKIPSKRNNNILILCGDVPFISSQSLNIMIKKLSQSDLCLGTFNQANPKGYGRVIRDGNKVIKIVEEKDASEKIKKVTEINTGIICIKEHVLRKYIGKINNNNKQKEFYLTDLISLLSDNNHKISTYCIKDELETMGINSKKDLVDLERKLLVKKATNLLNKGVLIRDVQRTDIKGDLKVQKDVDIDINCIFEDKVTIGSNSTIGHNCYLNRCKIGKNVHIKPNTIIFGATIGDNCIVGPYARIRPGAVLKNNSQVGNFVEVKNSTIGSGTKINHLSYIGDATLGSNINVGAGCITCNYDGENKYKTIIESNSFIGSGTRLVAPVTVAKGSYIAAGSTVTKDTPGGGSLTIARSKQVSIPKWKNKTIKGKK
jgi:bifunctional UDP-N-acetylglucosamine pyrophosphorylase / glucosamine-1-phosphate N-acetyltransferase